VKLGHFVNGRGRFFLVAAPLLLGVIAFAATRAYSYTQSPSFCSVCHTMKPAFELWETGEHREVDCHSCHEESFGESVVKLVTYAVLHPDHVEARAEVLPERIDGVTARNIYFERTPARLVTALITDEGVLRPDQLAPLVERARRRARALAGQTRDS